MVAVRRKDCKEGMVCEIKLECKQGDLKGCYEQWNQGLISGLSC